jgi:hypothetical protein
MKRKDKKKFMIVGGLIGIVILVSMISVAILSGKGEPPEEKYPGLEEYVETQEEFDAVNVMIGDEQTVYWDIGRPSNGTDVILVTGVQILITWTDDENPPALRPFYTNTPDTFILSVQGVPLLKRGDSSDGNQTNSTGDVIRSSSTSNMGSTRVNLDILNNPILLSNTDNSSGNATAWQWDPAGSSEHGNTGLFINITCVAGHIESSRPALLRYNDPGDQVTMNVKVFFKSIPEEVLNSWLEQNSRS